MGLRYARSAVVRGTIVGLWLVAGCGGSGGSTNDVELCASDLDCDDGLFCNGAERCDPASPFAFRSGCALGPAVCLEGQSCDEANARCLDECPDADGDGAADIACGGTDCDDADGNRFPGNPEVCDEGGHDEDCDASTVGMRDRDGDGYTDMACCNGTVCGDDCADAIGAIHPNATETCDGLDQDCDAAIDEGQTQTAYLDADGDLHGDEDAEAMPSCPGWARTSTTRIDCDDANGAVHGAQLELCDGMDNDCDGETDEDVVALPWYADADGDGFWRPARCRRSRLQPAVRLRAASARLPGWTTRPSGRRRLRRAMAGTTTATASPTT